MDKALIIEGRKYVSAKKAAEISGYTSDYVGQLSRAKKIPSRLVGRSWYVDELSLLDHKNNQPLLSRSSAKGVNKKNYRKVTKTELKQSDFVAGSFNDLIPQDEPEKVGFEHQTLQSSFGGFGTTRSSRSRLSEMDRRNILYIKDDSELFPLVSKKVDPISAKFRINDAISKSLSRPKARPFFERFIIHLSTAILVLGLISFSFFEWPNLSRGIGRLAQGSVSKELAHVYGPYLDLSKKIYEESFRNNLNTGRIANTGTALFSGGFKSAFDWVGDIGYKIVKPWIDGNSGELIPTDYVNEKEEDKIILVKEILREVPTNQARSSSVSAVDLGYIDFKISEKFEELKNYFLVNPLAPNVNRYYVSRQNDVIVGRSGSGGTTVVNNGASSLTDLSDLNLGSLTYGDVLMYNGSNWVNMATSSLGIVGGSGTGASTTLLADFNTFTNTNNFTGRLGLGSTSPFAKLSVNSEAGEAAFVVGSSTATSFIVDKNGNVGIGTGSPSRLLDVNGILNAKEYYLWDQRVLAGTANQLILNYSGSYTSVGINTLGIERFQIDSSGKIGIGTSTPFAQLQISTTTASATFKPQLALSDYSASSNQKHWTLSSQGGNFYIASATDVYATTSISALEISGSGFGTTTLRGLNIAGLATSTSNVGFNITAGCYAVNGTCVGGGSGASTTLLADFNTFSNTNNFTGSVGLSTTTPFARLSINNTAGENAFVIGSSTATSFIVDKSGNVGIGGINPGNYKMYVLGSDNYSTKYGTPDIFISSTHANSSPTIAFKKPFNANQEYRIGLAGNGDVTSDSFVILDALGGNYRFVLTPGGNFGLGGNWEVAGNPGSTLSVNGSASVGATFKSTAAPSNGMIVEGRVGIGTTSPYANLTVWGSTTGKAFEVVGNGVGASTTVLSVSNTGFGTTTLAGLNISGQATSTSNVGFNITAGCYAVNGTCVGGSGASTTLLADINSWTGVNRFNHASSTYHSFDTASTTNLNIGGQSFVSLLGTGLQLTSGALTLNSTGDWTGTLDGFEGSTLFSGKVSTSTTPTIGELAYWTSNGTPSTLGSIATGTISVPTGLTVTANRYVIGGNAAIALDTGYVIPLQSTLDSKLSSYDAWTHPAAGKSATTSELQVTGGLLSTASSTFSSDLRLSSLSNGALAIGSNGLVYSGATTTAGTGLTYSGNAFNVNTSQNISTLSNLTSNGLVYTAGGTGSLNVAATTTASCSGSTSCSTFTILGSSPVTITSTDSTASSTLLSDLNTWSTKQNLFGGASTTILSANFAQFGGTATSTFTGGGFLGIGTSSPTAFLSIQPAISTSDLFRVSSSTGAALFTINKDGRLIQNISSASAVDIQDGSGNSIFTVDTTSAASDSGIEITAGASQTGNLVDLLASDGTTFLSGFGAGGGLIMRVASTSAFNIYDSTSANPVFILNSLANRSSFGTSTQTLGTLTIASSTAQQLSLSAGAGIAQWTARNAGGNFYLSTTTVDGTSTTSISALEISGSGFGTTTLRGLNIAGLATSTSNVGFNITAGCYAVNGTCVGGSGASTTLLADFNTFTATTNNFTNKLGVGSSSPFAKLSVESQAGEAAFVVGSSTATSFLVSSQGKVGVGSSTTPNDLLTVWGNGDANKDSRVSVRSGGAATTETSGFRYVIDNVTLWDSIVDNGDSNSFKVISFPLSGSPVTALKIESVGFGTTTLAGLNISGQATSTSNVGFNITTGCYAVNGTCVGGGSGSGTVNSGVFGQLAFYGANGTAVSGTSTISVSTTTAQGRVGIATTTGFNATLTLQGAVGLDIFGVASSTGARVFTLSEYGGLVQNIASTTAIRIQDGSGNNVFTVDTTQTSGSGIDITAASGQTANLLNIFASNGTTNYLSVGPSGNFGVGTGTPTNLFTVATSTTAKEPVFDIYHNANGATSTIGFFVSTTTGSAAGVGLGLPSALANYMIVGNGKVQAGMAIVNGGLCVDNDGWCTASTTGRISAVETTVGGTDLAEIYLSEEALEPGDVIAISTPVNHIKLANPLEDKNKALGVIATDPGIIMGLKPGEEQTGNEYPVALAGRVPVKVSTENGNIVAGDYLTLSNTSGVAMRATESGNVIGRALETYDKEGVGKITMFVDNTYYAGDATVIMVNGTTTTIYMNGEENATSTDSGTDGQSTTTATTTSGLTAEEGLGQMIVRFLEEIGLKIMNGIAYMKDLFVERLTVGTPEKPSGITIYDEATGEPYCLKVVNGTMVSMAGECGTEDVDGNGNGENNDENNGGGDTGGGDTGTTTPPVLDDTASTTPPTIDPNTDTQVPASDGDTQNTDSDTGGSSGSETPTSETAEATPEPTPTEAPAPEPSAPTTEAPSGTE